MAKVLELQLQHQSFQWIFRVDSPVWSPCSPSNSQGSPPAPQFENINSSVLSLLYVQLSHLYTTTEKTIALIAAAAKSRQSCPTLCDPIDGSPPGSTVPGILQARTLEWVAISFSNASKWKVNFEVAQSCPTLRNPMDCSPPGSSVHGIFQARVLEWGATDRPFSAKWCLLLVLCPGLSLFSLSSFTFIYILLHNILPFSARSKNVSKIIVLCVSPGCLMIWVPSLSGAKTC